MSGSLRLSAPEQQAATELRATVAPVLAEGVVCALRDQPADPAGYMAEFLAGRQGGAQAVLARRRLGQECARLDAELAELNDQLGVARLEASRRLPQLSGADVKQEEAMAAASWSEVRRLKRLTRSMKIKISEPLSASDWSIPEGLIFVAGGPGVGARALCAQFGSDFSVGHVAAAGKGCVADPLGAAQRWIASRPAFAVLVEGFLEGERAREQLEQCATRVGRPTALVLLQCDEAVLVSRQLEASASEGGSLARDVAEAKASDWLRVKLPAIEAAAREAKLPVLKVECGEGFDAQMTNFLVALSNI